MLLFSLKVGIEIFNGRLPERYGVCNVRLSELMATGRMLILDTVVEKRH